MNGLPVLWKHVIKMVLKLAIRVLLGLAFGLILSEITLQMSGLTINILDVRAFPL